MELGTMLLCIVSEEGDDLNFSAEVNAYFDWLDTNPQEPTTQTLWFHLIGLANKSGCPEWFTVANPLLQAKVGITENTLIKHRNYLIQSGRIEYKSMGKQKAGRYRIMWFTSNNEVNCEANDEVNHEVNQAVNHAAKGAALLKIYKSTTSSSSSEPESFYSAYQRVFGHQCTPFQAEQLGQYIDKSGMEEALVIRALERTGSSASGRYRSHFSLVTKILNDYLHAGVRTVPQAMVWDKQFEDQASPGLPQQPKGRQASYNQELDELKQAKKEAMRREGIPVD
jgi:DnaD/phage-associated family protein